MARNVQVYLYNSSSRRELEEIYKLTRAEAEKLHDILYEVSLVVDLEAGRILGVLPQIPRMTFDEYVAKYGPFDNIR